MPKKLTPLEFAVLAIKKLRTKDYKGIHVVYSGFNSAYRAYFGNEPKADIDALVKAGKLEMRFAKGGAILYLPGDMPESKPRDDGKKTLAALGL